MASAQQPQDRDISLVRQGCEVVLKYLEQQLNAKIIHQRFLRANALIIEKHQAMQAQLVVLPAPVTEASIFMQQMIGVIKLGNFIQQKATQEEINEILLKQSLIVLSQRHQTKLPLNLLDQFINNANLINPIFNDYTILSVAQKNPAKILINHSFALAARLESQQQPLGPIETVKELLNPAIAGYQNIMTQISLIEAQEARRAPQTAAAQQPRTDSHTAGVSGGNKGGDEEKRGR